MSSFATSLIAHTLEATIQYIERTPGLDLNNPGLLEFTQTLQQKLSQIESHDGIDPMRGLLHTGESQCPPAIHIATS